MSEEDPLVNGQPLSSLRVVDLREELEKHGLSKTGNKNVLADRLREFLINGTREDSSPIKDKTPSAHSSPIKSPAGENLVAQYRARQEAALKEAALEKERARRESETSDQLASPTHAKQITEKTVEAAEVESAAGDDESKEDEEEKETVKEEKNETAPEEEAKEEEEKNDQVEEIENVATPTDGSNDNVSSTDASDKNEDTTEAESPVTKDPTPEPTPKITEENKKSATPVPEESVDNTKEEGVELDYGEAEDVAIEEEPKEEEKKDEVMETDASEAKRKRRISVEAPKEDEGVAKRSRQISPSRYPKSDILHIRGLMRPFTIPLLKTEICKEGGEILDFWIDNIRSHCFVKMRSEDETSAIREALHGIHWPSSNPKALAVQFDNQENMDRHKSGKESAAPVSTSLSRTSVDTPTVEKTEKPSERERRERPTLAPLPGRNGSLRITVEAMVRDNHKKEEEARERHEKEGKERTKEIERRIKLREEKEKEAGENKKRERSETPPHSLEDRKRERRVTDDKRRDERSRIESEPERKEERPVKTADEFFKKTKAQPAVYYAPLTEEEAEARAAKRARDRR